MCRCLVSPFSVQVLTPASPLAPCQASLSPYLMSSLTPMDPMDHMDHMDQSLPGNFNRSRSGSNVSIYNQLQFPSTSNYGSMKRKKRSGGRGSETPPFPPSPSSECREAEYYDNNVRIWSLEYTPVPRLSTGSKKTVKV